MSTLTDRLRHDHADLRQVLERVRTLGIGTPEGRATLLDARALFVEHIQREDAEFYPALRGLARIDPGAQAHADQFATEMKAISTAILGFFDKYRDGGSGLEFAIDFGRMHAMLHLRWYKEESILYARHDSLAAKAAA
ncbi:hemerythrin domain-containing protein [Azospirillum sp. B4]|uniref:hemerythrin domain-containing protein n=1 Tax=Azospirillum sp. B4 TaxID=95605 RepID=UPI000348350D|nr:hemerythrin domain-containing protein [Azospirillum sp. B4]